MDPYTPTWLAQHASPLVITIIQIGISTLAIWQRRFGLAAVVLASASTLILWLGPSLVALARSDALPPPLWEPMATAAPFLAVAAAAIARRGGERPVLGLRSAAGLLLVPHGLAAIALWLALLIAGSLEAKAPRSALLSAGIASWAATDVVHANRFLLYQTLGTGPPADHFAVSASIAGLTATAWGAIGVWMLSVRDDPVHPARSAVSEGGDERLYCVSLDT